MNINKKLTLSQLTLISHMENGWVLMSELKDSRSCWRHTIRRMENNRIQEAENVSGNTIRSLLKHNLIQEYPVPTDYPTGYYKCYILNKAQMLEYSKAKARASWSVSLDCDCPKCGKYVDLLQAVDFWDGRPLEIAQHDTPYSDNMEVACPECGHDFVVCCEW